MTMLLVAQSILTKISIWWCDQEDERLDALAETNYETLALAAEQSGITAYQLVSRARNS